MTLVLIVANLIALRALWTVSDVRASETGEIPPLTQRQTFTIGRWTL